MTKRLSILLGSLLLVLCAVALTGCRSAHVTSAILYIDLEQYQKAIDVINDGLYYSPDDHEAYYWLGESYSRIAQKAIEENDYLLARNSFASAYENYVHARELAPEAMSEQVAEALEINYRNSLREGQSMWREQHYEEAEGFFRLAYAALPDSLDSVKNIASMKIQQAELLPQQPDSAQTLRLEALDLLEQVLQAHPDAYRLQADKAYVLTQLDRTEQADALYRELLRDHGDDPGLLLDVIALYDRQQRNREAADLLLRVADIYQNDTDPANDTQLKAIYSEAGFHLRQAGELVRAIEVYSLASEQDVEDVGLLLERQQLYLLHAQELLEQSVKLTEQGDAAAAAAMEQQAMQALGRGVDVGRAVTALAPTNADGFFFLATTQSLLGDEAGYNENMKTYQELSGVQ